MPQQIIEHRDTLGRAAKASGAERLVDGPA
jgi:hypothetical protein